MYLPLEMFSSTVSIWYLHGRFIFNIYEDKTPSVICFNIIATSTSQPDNGKQINKLKSCLAGNKSQWILWLFLISSLSQHFLNIFKPPLSWKTKGRFRCPLPVCFHRATSPFYLYLPTQPKLPGKTVYFPPASYSSTHCNPLATWPLAPTVSWNCSGQDLWWPTHCQIHVLYSVFIFPNTSLAHGTVDTFLLLEIPLMASYELYAHFFSILLSTSHWCSWGCPKATSSFFTISNTCSLWAW